VQHKAIKATAGDSGEVTAIFSTFDVVDHDGDVTLPGAFTDGAKVRISAYNHTSWQGALPVGKGVIHTTETEAVMEGQFFMNTAQGRDTFTVVKELADIGEWSYGFDVDDAIPGEFDGQQVRFLRKLTVHEVSPVLLGAGIGTRTLAAKSLDDMTDEECERQAHEACKALLKRGLALPSDLVEAVRKMDAAADDTKRRLGSLRLIAAANGIDITREVN